MHRPILIPLLAFGTIAGFASGFHSLHHRHGCGRWAEDGWHHGGYDMPYAVNAPPPVMQAAPAPVQVQTAPAPAAPAPQTLVIPIIVGAPAQGSAAPAQTYVIPTSPQLAAPAPAPAPAPTGR